MSDKTTKSHLALALDRWMQSDVGRQARDISTLRPTDSNFLKNRLEGAFLAGARSQERISNALTDDFMAEISECLLGYREGREDDLLVAAGKLMALKLVCDTADELIESKKEIFAAAIDLRNLLQDSES